MFANDDVINFCSFLKQTPEGPLRKMLVGGDFTEAHLRILLKLAKGADDATFAECFTGDTFGKFHFSVKEAPLKENFWAICKKKVMSLGLITESKAAA